MVTETKPTQPASFVHRPRKPKKDFMEKYEMDSRQHMREERLAAAEAASRFAAAGASRSDMVGEPQSLSAKSSPSPPVQTDMQTDMHTDDSMLVDDTVDHKHQRRRLSSLSMSAGSGITDIPPPVKLHKFDDIFSAASVVADTTSQPQLHKRKKKRGNLPKEAVYYLKQWLHRNRTMAYPSEAEKLKMGAETNLTVTQINNWFINARRRILPEMLSKDGLDPRQFTRPRNTAATRHKSMQKIQQQLDREDSEKCIKEAQDRIRIGQFTDELVGKLVSHHTSPETSIQLEESMLNDVHHTPPRLSPLNLTSPQSISPVSSYLSTSPATTTSDGTSGAINLAENTTSRYSASTPLQQQLGSIPPPLQFYSRHLAYNAFNMAAMSHHFASLQSFTHHQQQPTAQSALPPPPVSQYLACKAESARSFPAFDRGFLQPLQQTIPQCQATNNAHIYPLSMLADAAASRQTQSLRS